MMIMVLLYYMNKNMDILFEFMSIVEKIDKKTIK